MKHERGRGRLYQQKDSRFWYYEVSLHGKPIRKSTRETDRKKADLVRKAVLRKIGADVEGIKKYSNPKSIAFAAFAEEFLRDVLSQKKYSTRVTEGSRIRNGILATFGHLQVRQMGPQVVQQFIAAISHPKTARNHIATLRMMYNAAKAWEYTSCDWFDGVTLPEYVKPEAPFFTLDEMRRIIVAAVGAFQVFCWLASETGMRLGELCALRVNALNLKTGAVVVRYSSWHGRQGSTKAKKARTFRLSPQLVERLREQIAPVAGDPDAFVFRASNGSPWIGDDVVKRWLKPLLKKLGIKQGVAHVGLHAFRHGNSTLMDSPEVNAPLKVRQDRVGHTEDEMTFIYTHAQGSEHLAVAAKLGELLAPPALDAMELASTKAM